MSGIGKRITGIVICAGARCNPCHTISVLSSFANVNNFKERNCENSHLAAISALNESPHHWPGRVA